MDIVIVHLSGPLIREYLIKLILSLSLSLFSSRAYSRTRKLQSSELCMQNAKYADE